MATYFDPISQEEFEVTEETFVYIVKLPDGQYGIKAFDGNAKQVSKDPTSNATDYWPIDTKALLSNQLTNVILFPAEKLTSAPLKLEQIKDFLKIDPEIMPPKPFNSALEGERLREWANEVVRQMHSPFQLANPQPQPQVARPGRQESIFETLENLFLHDQQFQSLPINEVQAFNIERILHDEQLESLSESSRTAISHNLIATRVFLYVLIRISNVSFEQIQTLTAMELHHLLMHIFYQSQWKNEEFRQLITDLLVLPEPIRALFIIEKFVAVKALVNTTRILPLADLLALPELERTLFLDNPAQTVCLINEVPTSIATLLALPESIKAFFIKSGFKVKHLVHGIPIAVSDLLALPVSDQILLVNEAGGAVNLVKNTTMSITDILALSQETQALFLKYSDSVVHLVNQLNVPLKRLLSMPIGDLAQVLIQSNSEEAEYILNRPWFDESHFPRLLIYITEQLATTANPETLFNSRIPQEAFAQLKRALKSDPITLDESMVQQLSEEPYYSQISAYLSEGLTAKDLFAYLTSSAAYIEKNDMEKKIRSIERDMQLYHKDFSVDERDALLEQYFILLERNNTLPENLHAKAVFFFKEENFTAAIKLADFAATKFININDKLNASTSYSVLASSYRKVNDLPAALEAAQKSYDLRLEIFNDTHPKTREIKKKLDEIKTLLSMNINSKP